MFKRIDKKVYAQVKLKKVNRIWFQFAKIYVYTYNNGKRNLLFPTNVIYLLVYSYEEKVLNWKLSIVLFILIDSHHTLRLIFKRIFCQIVHGY